MAWEPLRHSHVLLGSGIRMHVVQLAPPLGVQAKGTVLCVHGFPDTWFGYRHQLRALASRGWHVVVPDQRGYGETDAPRQVSAYQMRSLCGDMCALLDVLGLDRVVLLGHDWGGTLVWNMALQHQDRVAAVAAVCTPFFPTNPNRDPWPALRANPGRFDYQVWFQTGSAEEALEADPERTVLCAIRGTGAADEAAFAAQCDGALVAAPPSQKGGWLKGMPAADHCPRSEILSAAELQYYTAQFRASGFFGPLSWYRNVTPNWEWMKSTAGRKVEQPALMVTAGRDAVLKASMVKSLKMHEWIPQLVHRHVEEAGHWVLQERPAEVNEHLCTWLDTLPPLGTSKL